MFYKNKSNSTNEKNPTRRQKWQRYLPLVFLIVLGGNAALILTQLEPALKAPAELPSEFEPVKLGGREIINEKITDEEFRRLALETDRAQLERLRAKKLARKTLQHPDHASQYHQDRIEEMENQLRKSFSKSEMKAKGSVANAMKKEIERMRQDMPQ